MTVLLAWELGGGFGHIGQLVPLVKGLMAQGHRVAAALREPGRGTIAMGPLGVTILPAAHKPPGPQNLVARPRTFAHVLWGAGYADADELQALAEAWDAVFDAVAADLIVFDYAPTALLAARGREVIRVALGNGFFCPPDHAPLADLRPWLPPEAAALLEDECRVLENMNRVLVRRSVEPLERVTQLFGDVDETFLTTLAEMDHYSCRQPALTPCPSPVRPSTARGRGETGAPGSQLPAPRYRGPWSMPGGVQPIWPAGSGKRVYAYLKPFPGLPKILTALRLSGCPTIVFGGFGRATQARFAAANIRFESRSLDLRRVAAECDAAVLNAGHATTLEFLLAGVPILQSPIFLEQAITARNTVRMGAGLVASLPTAERTAEQLAGLLDDSRYRDSARAFAAKYAGFSAAAEIGAAVDFMQTQTTK